MSFKLFKEITGNNWFELITYKPKYAKFCDWSKLTLDHWAELDHLLSDSWKESIKFEEVKNKYLPLINLSI